MIVSITGILTSRTPGTIIINVNGLGYACHISTNSFEDLPETGSQLTLLTYYHVTENSHELYAFSGEAEREFFKLLIGVSGIGPKTAIQLLSAVRPDEFKKRIVASEVGMLTALPGIGPKTARRIIIELKDKFVKMTEDEMPIETSDPTRRSAKESHEALVSLGFRTGEVRKVLQQILKENKEIQTEQIIKKALTLLR